MGSLTAQLAGFSFSNTSGVHATGKLRNAHPRLEPLAGRGVGGGDPSSPEQWRYKCPQHLSGRGMVMSMGGGACQGAAVTLLYKLEPGREGETP